MFGFGGKRTEADRPAAKECSFCRLPRVSVGHLVAGPDSAICDDCAVLAVAALEESSVDTADATETFPFVAMALVQVVGSPASSDERAEAAARVALEVAAGATPVLRKLAVRALEAERFAIAVRGLKRIPEEDRTHDDRVGLSMTLWHVGAFEDGLATLEGFEPESETERAEVLESRAAHRLRMHEELSESWLVSTVGKLDQAVSTGHLVAVDVATTKAECLARLGRYQEARNELESKARVEGLTALDLMVLGDVAMALGDHPEATEYYGAAAELGGVMADEVALRLSRISPYR